MSSKSHHSKRIVTSREQIESITWSDYPPTNAYWRNTLRNLWDLWNPDRLIFAGDGRTLKPRDIIYRPATGGRWGRSSKVYVGRALKQERQAREADQQKQREAEALALYEAVLHEVLREHHAEGCFSVTLPPTWMWVNRQVMVYEHLHDAQGALGYRVESPEALRAHLLRSIPSHRQIYHQA